MKGNEKRMNMVALIKRLVKRLPELVLIALIVFTGFCLWMETESAKYATAFTYRTLFDYSLELSYIPLFYKLAYTIPSSLLVFLFAEDIIKVSIKNEPSRDEPMQIT